MKVNRIIALCVLFLGLCSFSIEADESDRRFFKRQRPTKYDVNESLKKLQKDTLYVINRTCPGMFSDAEIQTLFDRYYTFSQVKLLEDFEIDGVSKRSTIVHFAVIGQYFKNDYSACANGIFLLDKKLNLCTRPYPYHVRQYWVEYLLSKCLDSDNDVKEVVSLFDTCLRATLTRR